MGLSDRALPLWPRAQLVPAARFQNIVEYVGGHFGRTDRTCWPPSRLALVALQVFMGMRHVHQQPPILLPSGSSARSGKPAVGADLCAIEELRQALLAFRETYNTTWLIERQGFLTPAQFRQRRLQTADVAA